VEKLLQVVLMADDDEEDCMLAAEAFKESGATGDFACVEDGVELMDHLGGCSLSGEEKLPCLILLDLNMPRKDGREALREIKSDFTLQKIPVVILTTSREQKDIAFSTQAGASGFITKPDTFEKWIEIMKSLNQYVTGVPEEDH
jgi:CheY-like chemotaxis protein